MKKLSKKQIGLFITGILMTDITFLLRHFMEINDFIDGVFKGIGIGLMILVVYRVSRQNKMEQKTNQ